MRVRHSKESGNWEICAESGVSAIQNIIAHSSQPQERHASFWYRWSVLKCNAKIVRATISTVCSMLSWLFFFWCLVCTVPSQSEIPGFKLFYWLLLSTVYPAGTVMVLIQHYVIHTDTHTQQFYGWKLLFGGFGVKPTWVTSLGRPPVSLPFVAISLQSAVMSAISYIRYWWAEWQHGHRQTDSDMS